MKLVLDEDSFTPAYWAAYRQTMSAHVEAGKTIKGAGRKAEYAALDREDLIAFRSALSKHIRDGSFGSLPGFRANYLRIPDCHHLTKGPWKGIFLLDPEGDVAIGLVFSKAPHEFMGRLNELLALYKDAKEEERDPE